MTKSRDHRLCHRPGGEVDHPFDRVPPPRVLPLLHRRARQVCQPFPAVRFFQLRFPPLSQRWLLQRIRLIGPPGCLPWGPLSHRQVTPRSVPPCHVSLPPVPPRHQLLRQRHHRQNLPRQAPRRLQRSVPRKLPRWHLRSTRPRAPPTVRHGLPLIRVN
jgi:hypothetical protein